MTKGDRIRFARLNKNMTLDDLARACDTTKQTINKYEKGIITNIPSDKVELLGKALDISPAYIMGWETSGDPGDLDREIMDLLRSLPENTRRSFLQLLKDFIE